MCVKICCCWVHTLCCMHGCCTCTVGSLTWMFLSVWADEVRQAKDPVAVSILAAIEAVQPSLCMFLSCHFVKGPIHCQPEPTHYDRWIQSLPASTCSGALFMAQGLAGISTTAPRNSSGLLAILNLPPRSKFCPQPNSFYTLPHPWRCARVPAGRRAVL